MRSGWSPRRVERFGRIDIVVNAVGGGAGKVLHPAEDYPRDDWDWIMELNVRSTVVPTAGRRPGDDRGGPTAARSSTSRRSGRSLGINAGYSAYVAAKGAISSLTRQWATEWAKHGIRVNAIMPTFVDTPQVAMLLEDPAVQGRASSSRIPLGRVGETRDIVGPAIFLCSDAASFVTGQVLGHRRRPDGHPVARSTMPTATSSSNASRRTSTRRRSCAAATRASS